MYNALLLFTSTLSAATLGRTIPLVGGAADLALDEPRARVYLTSGTQNLVQVYSLQRQSFQGTVTTDQTPLAAALSRDNKYLYVACYDASLIDVIDLDALSITARINLPARPEALAVAKDGRVLISTSGSGTTGANGLLLYNPAGPTLTALSVVPPTASALATPAPLNRPFLSMRTELVSTRDGAYIAGVNVSAAGLATVYLFEAASGSILRSRTITGSSISIAISPDGSRVFSGVNLFDAATFQVLAQHSPINAVYPLTPLSSFAATINTAPTNQGGSVFSPDGQTLYSGLNSSSGNVAQLMMSDPDNLLIRMGIQMPDNMAGKMVISPDGANIYVLTDNGFAIIPVGTISTSPLATAGTAAVLLTRDQCGVTAVTSSGTINVNNPGRGRITVNSQLLQFTGVPNLGSGATAPSVRATQTTIPTLTYSFNASLTRGLGTMVPTHDFSIQAPEAVNIGDRVRVYENVRDSEARGTILPLPTGNPGGATPFPDMVLDSTRQRIYIANSGLNRVEVYDLKTQRFLTPIKVGQSPQSLGLTPDGFTLYVANAGGENISIVDPDKLASTGWVKYPPLPLNSTQPILVPTVIATSTNSPMILMNTGALWRIIGDTALPRGVSKVIGQTAQGAPAPLPLPSTMTSTPAGEFILLSTATGIAYLYDASADDFIATRTLGASAGYSGPVVAGARGQFFVVNGTLLNQALIPTRAPVGLIAASTPVGNTTYAVFSPPAAAAANTLPTTVPTVQIVDGNSGATTLSVPALEGPFTQAAGGARSIVGGRMMAVDGNTAYVLTVSGLSLVPLTTVAAADRPQPFNRGAVNLASYQTAVAPNSLLSIFGNNLGASEIATTAPLPTSLGGICVTLNNVPMPLFMTSPGQINAQIPPNLSPGSYPLVIRSLTKQAASAAQTITVSKYAPAVLVAPDGQIALFHHDGSYVNQDNPANRDEPLVMYALGLGATKGGAVTAGNPSPTTPLAVTDEVEVFFGDPDFKQSAVIVDFSGLTPGFIGLYQLNLRVPGFHEKGPTLPVTLRMGTTNSPTSGPVVPYVAVN